MLVEPVSDVIYQVMLLPIKKLEPVHGLWVKNSLSLLKLLCLKSTLIFTQAVSLQAFNKVQWNKWIIFHLCSAAEDRFF